MTDADESRTPRFGSLHVVRGRIKARGRALGLVDEAELPEPLAARVHDVIRRLRVGRRARLDVTVELVNHCLDGLASGTGADALASAFGDPAVTARLINRAKRRRRSLARRSIKWIGGALALLVLAYLGVGVRLVLSEPVVSVDYLAQLTARARGVREPDRAWPLYREALADLSAAPLYDKDRTPRPGEPAWSEISAFLTEHRAALDVARQAARRPGLGFVVGYDVDEEDREALWPDLESAEAVGESVGLVGVLQPQLAELRRLSHVLRFDALEAATTGDGKRAIADIEALLAISEHARETPLVLNELIALSSARACVDVSLDILELAPAALDDGDLARLTLVAGSSPAFDRPRLIGETLLFRDFVQRSYSDDGEGDGRLNQRGLSSFDDLGNPTRTVDRVVVTVLRVVVGPVIAYTVAPRREILEAHDRVMAMYEEDAQVPPWEIDEQRAPAQLDAWSSRYMPILLLIPVYDKVRFAHESLLLRRDGLLAAIAIESHRRRTGAWPDSLGALVPELLLRMPVDRFDGAPLRYRIDDDGRPLVYSVGTDRIDDGGAHPRRRSDGSPRPELAQQWLPRSYVAEILAGDPAAQFARFTRGDWVLWPRYVPPLEPAPNAAPAR